MIRNTENTSLSGMVIAFLILLNAIFLKSAYLSDDKNYSALLITLPLLAVAIWDRLKK